MSHHLITLPLQHNPTGFAVVENTLALKCFSVEMTSFIILLYCIRQITWSSFLSNRQGRVVQKKRILFTTRHEWCLHLWCTYKLIAFHMCSLSFVALIHCKTWYLSAILENSQPIFFKYDIWIIQGYEHQLAGIIGTLESLLPQPSVPKLDEMLHMDMEAKGGFLPGSWAVSCNWDGEAGP